MSSTSTRCPYMHRCRWIAINGVTSDKAAQHPTETKRNPLTPQGVGASTGRNRRNCVAPLRCRFSHSLEKFPSFPTHASSLLPWLCFQGILSMCTISQPWGPGGCSKVLVVTLGLPPVHHCMAVTAFGVAKLVVDRGPSDTSSDGEYHSETSQTFLCHPTR